MLKHAWREKFPEFANSSETLEALLLQGKLREDVYISWASEHYKIPSVDKVFFSQIKNLQIMIQNPSPAWTTSFFPVHEWQGMLYIACIEPREIQIDKKHCFVLGSYKEMVALWNKMEKPAVAAKPITPLAAHTQTSFTQTATAPATPARTPNPTPTPPPSATRTPPSHPTPTPTPSANPPPPVAAPALNRNPIPPQHPPSSASSSAPSKTPTAVRNSDSQPVTPPQASPAVTPTPAAPVSVPVSASATAPSAQKPPPPVAAEEDPFSASVVIPLRELDERLQKAASEHEAAHRASKDSESTRSNINFNPNMTSGGMKIPEITNVFKVAANKDMTFTTTKTIMPFPESTKDFTFIRTVYSEHVIGEARSRVQDNREPQEALISAFKILKDYYKKLMWVVRDEKGRAFPIACNDEWSFTEEAWNLPVNFKAANPFRLAKFTQRPYHGSVYKSPVNDQYFDQWNGSKYPDVMTIIPVKMGGKVFGYFVGCDKGPHFHKDQTLETMEKVCAELVQTFQRIHEELSVKKKPA